MTEKPDNTEEAVARLSAISFNPEGYGEAVLDAYCFHPAGQFYVDLNTALSSLTALEARLAEAVGALEKISGMSSVARQTLSSIKGEG